MSWSGRGWSSRSAARSWAGRLLLVEGRVQKSPDGVVHLVAERIVDRTAELERLSEDDGEGAVLSAPRGPPGTTIPVTFA